MKTSKTITFDETIYRLVSINPTEDRIDGTLPGVVEHSGEPVAFLTDDGKMLYFSDDLAAKYRNGQPLFTHPPAQPDTAALQARIAELERINIIEQSQAAHWKANHDNMVKKAAFLSERPDLPVDRIPAYDRLTRKLAATQALSDEHFATILDLRAQLAAQAGQEPILYTAVPIRKIPSDWPELDTTNAAFAAIGWNECRDAVLKAQKTDTPAPANALAIVQSAMEAAAKACDRHAGGCSNYAEQCAKDIRAINPQTIIDAARNKCGS